MADGSLTAEESAELDSYGELTGADLLGVLPLPARAKGLWEREILFGSPATKHMNGIIGQAVIPGGVEKSGAR